MGKNASGQTHYLSLSGLELYGTVTAVCEDQLGEGAVRPPRSLPLSRRQVRPVERLLSVCDELLPLCRQVKL